MDQILSEDKLLFTHIDPSKIGNGPHDYNVYYDGVLMGKLSFPKFDVSMYNPPPANCVVFINNNLVYNTGTTIDELSGISSNEEILDLMKPRVISVITKNKIV